jgi:hypothetical protein
MIRKCFFLSSHDYVSTPEPRECQYICESICWNPPKTLLCVSIKPPLPGYLKDIRDPEPPTTVISCYPREDSVSSYEISIHKYNNLEKMTIKRGNVINYITILLLCPAHSRYTENDIDTNRFVVDIYAIKDNSIRQQYDPRELVRLGMGVLHSNLQDAIKASPKE